MLSYFTWNRLAQTYNALDSMKMCCGCVRLFVCSFTSRQSITYLTILEVNRKRQRKLPRGEFFFYCSVGFIIRCSTATLPVVLMPLSKALKTQYAYAETVKCVQIMLCSSSNELALKRLRDNPTHRWQSEIRVNLLSVFLFTKELKMWLEGFTGK